jgi:hypothetical protein
VSRKSIAPCSDISCGSVAVWIPRRHAGQPLSEPPQAGIPDSSGTLTEFTSKELKALEAKGISIHHLAMFLEAIRHNLYPDQLKCLMIQEEQDAA